MNAIKSSEYKKYAFERGPLEYSETNDKVGMSKTCATGFFAAPEKPEESEMKVAKVT